jgi:hypothetical protein
MKDFLIFIAYTEYVICVSNWLLVAGSLVGKAAMRVWQCIDSCKVPTRVLLGSMLIMLSGPPRRSRHYDVTIHFPLP